MDNVTVSEVLRMRNVVRVMISIVALLAGGNASANELSELFKHYNGEEVEFIGLHDPGFIELKRDNGQIIDTAWSGTESDFETLFKQEGKGRVMTLSYTIDQGVTVIDRDAGIRIELVGVVEPHPIDMAVSACRGAAATTVDIMRCKTFGLEAWDAELNRVYSRLGGSNNPLLKKTQLAWIKYRDTQVDYIRSYFSRQGTIWPLISMDHVINVKNQAQMLSGIRQEW